MQNLNYEPLIEKTQNIFKFWNSKYLSLFGKAFVCNTFVLTKIWFRSDVIGMSNNYIKTFNNYIYNFTWWKERGNIARDIISRPRNLGGVGLESIFERLWARNVMIMVVMLKKMNEGTHWTEF